MAPSKIAELAVALAAGGVTADAIEEHYGHDILANVLAFTGGLGAATLAPTIMREFGISQMIDDLFDF